MEISDFSVGETVLAKIFGTDDPPTEAWTPATVFAANDLGVFVRYAGCEKPYQISGGLGRYTDLSLLRKVLQ